MAEDVGEKPLQVCLTKEAKEYIFNVLTREALHRQDDIRVVEKETGERYQERLKVLKEDLRNAVLLKIFVGSLPVCKDDIALDIKRKEVI